MTTLSFILDKFKVSSAPIIEVPNFGRDQMAAMFAELGFKVGAEIGTEKGRYAEVLYKSIPGLQLSCIDPWTDYTGYTDIHGGQPTFETNFAETQRRLAPFNVAYIRKFSTDAVKDFKDGSLDFVYIDGNHDYPHVVEDLCQWSRKVKSGGIVSGHDYVKYRKQQNSHVEEAVTGFVSAYKISPLFILGRKEAWLAEVRDKWRSWMFVKP